MVINDPQTLINVAFIKQRNNIVRCCGAFTYNYVHAFIKQFKSNGIISLSFLYAVHQIYQYDEQNKI